MKTIVNKLKRNTINKIATFIKKVNYDPLQTKRLVFDDNIVGTYQRKFKKENACEITFDTHNNRRAQFKE
jgi:hypothetical protein